MLSDLAEVLLSRSLYLPRTTHVLLPAQRQTYHRGLGCPSPHPKLRAEEELWAYESFEIAGGLGQAGEIAVEDKGDRHYCWGGGS